MPTYVYEFQDTGERRDVFQKMSDAKHVVLDGRPVNRIITVGRHQISMGELGVQDKYPYVSKSLPRGMPGMPVNEKGQPIVKSRKHEKDVQARFDMAKE